MVRASEIVARAVDLTIVTPIAPATLTLEPPLPVEEVSALARLVPPVVPPPAPPEVPRWLAKFCWLSAWPLAPSRPLLELEPESSLLPPATLALARDSFVE